VPSQAGGIGERLPGEPDPRLTPGALDPNVTQDDIGVTICVVGWTDTIRPSVSYTDSLKVEQIAQYGYNDTNPADYEEDHLVPLELGGAPTDPRNLWPEPLTASLPDGRDTGAAAKDTFENQLAREVCAGTMTLAQAQAETGAQWVHFYYSIPVSPTATTAGPTSWTGPFGVTLVNPPTSLARREATTFTAQTTEGARCSIRVKLPSGVYSTNTSLKTVQTADSEGLVSWGWSVQYNTKPGTATVRVTCTLAGATKTASASFSITAS
jgi:hypothetical protein